MKRLVAAALVAAAVTPVATATALPPVPPQTQRTIGCVNRYVVEQQDVRLLLWCLSLRES